VTRARVVGRGLEKRFGRSPALRGVDFEVGAGEVLAVVGPNGAGKSTLLRMVAGLARPSAGRLLIDEIPAGRPQARARIGYVGHATFLYPQLTARENLIFAGRLQGLRDPAARADALLAEEGLLAAADRSAGGFSRGMAQRLALARARMHDPSVWLLDEPFTGLDRRASLALADRIRALRAEGRALLLVTHDLAQAAELADAALVLANGRCAALLRAAALSASALEAAYAFAAETAS
jgi:heme ABC exporter ATP-binding subunit CcmA